MPVSALAEPRSVERVCASCGEMFEDRRRSGAPRSYCLTCRPPKGLAVASARKPRDAVKGRPFTVAHFGRWSSRFKLKDGSFFRLDPYQARFLEDLFERDCDGRPVHSELWLVVPEGNGKTTFVALIVLYTLEFKDEAWVPIAASARDQAVDLTYRLCSGFVSRNRLDDVYRLHPGYRSIVHRLSMAAAKIFASDAASGDGVDPDLAVIEELHRLDEMDLYETWSGKLDKSDGQLLIVSTAGEPGSAFEELRERIRQTATEVTRERCFVRAAGNGVVLHEYAIPEDGDPEDLQLVAEANPLRSKTVESLAKKRAKPTWRLEHWLRFTCNLPTRAAAAAITERQWSRQTATKKIPAGKPVDLGADFGWANDTTALVPLYDLGDGKYQLGEAAILEPPPNGAMTDPETVKRAFMQIHARNPVQRVVMDMSLAQDIAGWISDELGILVIDRAQGNVNKCRDYAAVMRGLRQRTLWHSGDPGLTRHALNAHVKVLTDGKERFVRPKESRKVSVEQRRRRVIDALDAAAMVYSEAVGEPVGVQSWRVF